MIISSFLCMEITCVSFVFQITFFCWTSMLYQTSLDFHVGFLLITILLSFVNTLLSFLEFSFFLMFIKWLQDYYFLHWDFFVTFRILSLLQDGLYQEEHSARQPRRSFDRRLVSLLFHPDTKSLWMRLNKCLPVWKVKDITSWYERSISMKATVGTIRSHIVITAKSYCSTSWYLFCSSSWITIWRLLYYCSNMFFTVHGFQ